MCSLFVVLGSDPDYPILVGANRDEVRSRPASPPGLYVGSRRRILSPRDRQAGGTWMGVNDRLWFAGLTNVAGGERRPGAATRGTLPHLALDQREFADVEGAIADEVDARVYNDFQLLVTDGSNVVAFRKVGSSLAVEHPQVRILTLTNEHELNALVVPDLTQVTQGAATIAERMAVLARLLLDDGRHTGHRVLKAGGEYGTVSSSLVAVPRVDARQLSWKYAAGSPDQAPYRDYGNLGRRLLPE
ncbi:MAG: NRDE family protein [Planctomycetota bacterium]